MKAALFVVLSLVFAPACGDDGTSLRDAAADAVVDAGTPDADCFTNPVTHDEIINACTTAQKITKNPTLPLLGADGSLPPVP